MATPSTILTATQVNEIRGNGNQFFAKGNYPAAITSYSRCVLECLKALNLPGEEGEVPKELLGKFAVNGEDGNNDVSLMRNTLLLAWSNRAEAFLRLKKYENALLDAEKALELDPTNLKSLNRKGKALEALYQFEKANLCFLDAFKLSPQDENIREAMKRTKICFQQSQHGDYDLAKFYLNGCKGILEPCCDYVGPVEIKRTPSGGRGLLLTRNVVTGDLLFVSNALAVAPILPEPSITYKGLQFHNREQEAEHLISKLAKLAQTCPKSKRQLLALAYKDSQQDMEIPSMDLFKPGSDWMGIDSEPVELDICRIWGITCFSTYNLNGHTADISEYYNPRRLKRTGVWPLPSFLSHSCYPNCLRVHVGNAMFVRAMRDICLGEELTIAWFDVLDPLKARQDSCKNWNFLCRCCRCIFEGSTTPLEQMGKSLYELVLVKPQELTARFASLLPAVEEIIRSLEHLESKERNWIRASCIYVYIAQAQLLRTDLQRRIPFLDAIVESIMSVAGAGMFGLEHAADLLRDVGRHYGKTDKEYAKTEKRVLEIFRVAYGTQNKKALLALIQNFQNALGPSGVS